MAEGFQGTWSQDRNVSRQNLRHEKRLRKQLDVLEKERNWKSKSLAADKRCFEEKVHRLNMNPTDRAHLAKGTSDMVATDKKKELDRLLKSLLHRPYETRAGYSYIEYLSRNMQPLVKRPLQWGVNPPLSSPRMRGSVDACQAKTDQRPSVFLEGIEGQTVSLNQRVAIPIKRRGTFKPGQTVLPPIIAKAKLEVQHVKTTVLESQSSAQAWKRREISRNESRVIKPRKKSREIDVKNISARIRVTEERNEKKTLPSPVLDSKEKEDKKEVKTEEKDVFVTMVRLDVPTPNYYHLEVPTMKDDRLRDNNDEIKTSELESHSQGYYTFTIGGRDCYRRKSI